MTTVLLSGGVSWEDVIFPLKALGPFWVLVFLFYASWRVKVHLRAVSYHVKCYYTQF